MPRDRIDANPPIFLETADGSYIITRLNQPGFKLKKPFGPVYVDPVDIIGKVQISDEQSNVVKIGYRPDVLIQYVKSLTEASVYSPEALPQIRRVT